METNDLEEKLQKLKNDLDEEFSHYTWEEWHKEETKELMKEKVLMAVDTLPLSKDAGVCIDLSKKKADIRVYNQESDDILDFKKMFEGKEGPLKTKVKNIRVINREIVINARLSIKVSDLI